ncbi:MAG: FAD-binding oxidoreductase, partial [Clostridiales bacterium]
MNLIRPLTEDYSDYLRDESRTMGYADTISFVKSEEDIVAVVQYCFQHNIPINIQGARTGLAGGASPLGGHVLNVSRMTKITGMRFDPISGNYFLTVQPGVLLSQVRKALENKAFDISGWSAQSIHALSQIKPGELFFSPDPTESTASIGGMAACNASGARSFLYGSTRVHISGMRIVLADGSVTVLQRGVQQAHGRDFSLTLNSGQQLTAHIPDFDTPHTKDAGFYFRDDMDLLDLFIGSQGTLGIISQLEIALMPAPKLMWGATTFLPNDEAALRFIRAVRGEAIPGVPLFQHKPASLEFFNKNALEMVLKQKEVTSAFSQLLEIPANFNCAVYSEFNDSDPHTFLPILNELAQVVTACGGDP